MQDEPHLLDALGGYEVQDLCGHVQVWGCHVAQRDAVLGQQPGQGVDCAAVLQVTHHGDLGQGTTTFNLSQNIPPGPSPWQGEGRCVDQGGGVLTRGRCVCPHRHAVDGAQLLPDGEHVQESLCGVLPHPVTCVDHRPATLSRCRLETHRTSAGYNKLSVHM